MKSSNTSITLIIDANSSRASEKGFDWISLGPTAVTALIAILGWMIVERFARRREQRTDHREMLKTLTGDVEKISVEAIEFYRLAGSDPQAQRLAHSIRARIQGLSRQIEIMNLAGLGFKANDELRVFRQAVTGGEFDSARRRKSPDNSPVYQQFSNAGLALISVASIGFYESLRPRVATVFVRGWRLIGRGVAASWKKVTFR